MGEQKEEGMGEREGEAQWGGDQDDEHVGGHHDGEGGGKCQVNEFREEKKAGIFKAFMDMQKKR